MGRRKRTTTVLTRTVTMFTRFHPILGFTPARVENARAANLTGVWRRKSNKEVIAHIKRVFIAVIPTIQRIVNGTIITSALESEIKTAIPGPWGLPFEVKSLW